EAGSTINIYDGTTLLGTTTADASGSWSFTPTTGLGEGTHSLTVTATDSS
ncbi:Ig-like domain-containing protein, partial [Burkholderia multivorans]